MQRQTASLVPAHPDDPGHSGIIELAPGRTPPAELSGSDPDILADVPGEPGNLADGIPALLTLAAHPPSVKPVSLTQAGFA